MFIDKLMEIFDAASMTSHSASTPVSLSSANAGAGEPLTFLVSAPAAAGAGPLTLTVQSSATSGGTYTTVATFVLTTTQLSDGETYKFTLPTPTLEFLKVTPSGTFSAGALDMAITPDVQTNV